MAQQFVYGRKVEVYLAGVFRLEVIDLQINNHEAAQPKVVKQQVETKVLTAGFEMVLAAHEGEAFSEFEDQRTEMFEQTALPLREAIRQGQEFEIIGVLHELPGQIGLGLGQRLAEIRDSLALAVDQATLDLMNEDGTAPAVLGGLAGVPKPVLRVF